MFPFSDLGPRRITFPFVKCALIALCSVVFIYELAVGGLGLLFGNSNPDLGALFLRWGFIPQELTQGEPFTLPSIIRTPAPTEATIFSSMFIHGGFLHFAGNMLFLWVFGDRIEDRLGHVKFLVFYLVAGVVAALSHLMIDPHSHSPLVGASGAISGVMGAYLLLYPRNRVRALILFYLITVVEVRAIYLLGLWFLWQLVQGLLAVGLSHQVSVAFFAHVGGFVAGLVMMLVYKTVFDRRGRGDDGYKVKQLEDNWRQDRR